jgi:hypothetical protein
MKQSSAKTIKSNNSKTLNTSTFNVFESELQKKENVNKKVNSVNDIVLPSNLKNKIFSTSFDTLTPQGRK